MTNQSISGGGGSAGLKRDARGVQMNELGIGGQVQEFDRLRQQQQRRRREQQRVGERHDGADRAGVGGLPVGILVGLRRPSGMADRIGGGEVGGVGRVGYRRAGLK